MTCAGSRISQADILCFPQVRLEQGCQELQEVSTFSQLETPLMAGAQLAGILVSCVLVTVLVIGALLWRSFRKKNILVNTLLSTNDGMLLIARHDLDARKVAVDFIGKNVVFLRFSHLLNVEGPMLPVLRMNFLHCCLFCFFK